MKPAEKNTKVNGALIFGRTPISEMLRLKLKSTLNKGCEIHTDVLTLSFSRDKGLFGKKSICCWGCSTSFIGMSKGRWYSCYEARGRRRIRKLRVSSFRKLFGFTIHQGKIISMRITFMGSLIVR